MSILDIRDSLKTCDPNLCIPTSVRDLGPLLEIAIDAVQFYEELVEQVAEVGMDGAQLYGVARKFEERAQAQLISIGRTDLFMSKEKRRLIRGRAEPNWITRGTQRDEVRKIIKDHNREFLGHPDNPGLPGEPGSIGITDIGGGLPKSPHDGCPPGTFDGPLGQEGEPGQRDMGIEEGDTCGRGGCRGVLSYPSVENCSCHISPPCAQCVENKLRCPVCHWEEPGKNG